MYAIRMLIGCQTSVMALRRRRNEQLRRRRRRQRQEEFAPTYTPKARDNVFVLSHLIHSLSSSKVAWHPRPPHPNPTQPRCILVNTVVVVVVVVVRVPSSSSRGSIVVLYGTLLFILGFLQ